MVSRNLETGDIDEAICGSCEDKYTYKKNGRRVYKQAFLKIMPRFGTAEHKTSKKKHCRTCKHDGKQGKIGLQCVTPHPCTRGYTNYEPK